MSRILGQSQAISILSAALRSGRFHHAWIFSGPRGVGKFTTALAVARAILHGRPDAGPDERPLFGDSTQTTPREEGPDSPVPRLSEPGVFGSSEAKASPLDRADSQLGEPGYLHQGYLHPDLHIIRKELALFSDDPQLRDRKLSNIPIDVLRERMIGGKTGDDRIHEAPAYRTANMGHGKMFIIDEAELLDHTGQNSLLKTLEEPPPQTYFFLITSQPDRLLSTIRSRCQQVRFNRLDSDSMREWLRAKASGISGQVSAPRQTDTWHLTPDTLSWIEPFADGSPGLAQLAIEYGFYNWHMALAPMIAELERGKFPVAMGETMGGLVEEFAAAWVKKHKNASKDAANKDGARHLFSLLAGHVRRTLVERVLNGQEAAAPMAAVELIRQAERELESNVNLKLLLANLVVQWSQAIAPAEASARP